MFASGQPGCLPHTDNGESSGAGGGGLSARKWVAYLDVTAPAVQVEVQVLYLAVLAECVVDCLLVDLLVQVCDDDDPALYGAHGSGLGVGHHVVDLCLGGLG